MRKSFKQDPYAERAVLGCLLTSNHAWHAVGDYLQTADFSVQLLRDIYSSIEALLAEGEVADVISVSQHLMSRNQVNGDPFAQLCEIINSNFTAENIKLYAEIIKQQSQDRKLVVAAQQMIVNVKDQREDRLSLAQQTLNEIVSDVPSSIVLAKDILKSVLATIHDRNGMDASITGLSTGFIAIDNLTCGLQNGDLIILAGRPSMGKTLLAMNIAEHVALVDKRTVAVFSLEMSKEKLIERSISSVGEIESSLVRSGKLEEHHFQYLSAVVSKYHEANLFIDDRSYLRVSDMRAACGRLKHEHTLSLVIVDYISLMAATGENETLRIANISRGLKLLARDLNVPVIAISQLNRALEQRSNKRPCMADLRQSGAIEQDADLILFIYRDDVYDSTSSQVGLAEIIVAKHRNGEVGTIHMAFNPKICRFDNDKGETFIHKSDGQSWSRKSLIY
jgi:replicative DNA helicase